MISVSSPSCFPARARSRLGMLAELAAMHPQVQRDLRGSVARAAGVDLWALSQQGPEEQLNQTEFTQPALLAAGVAVWRACGSRRAARSRRVLAGHSLGEYAALVAAGAMSLADAATWCASAGG